MHSTRNAVLLAARLRGMDDGHFSLRFEDLGIRDALDDSMAQQCAGRVETAVVMTAWTPPDRVSWTLLLLLTLACPAKLVVNCAPLLVPSFPSKARLVPPHGLDAATLCM